MKKAPSLFAIVILSAALSLQAHAYELKKGTVAIGVMPSLNLSKTDSILKEKGKPDQKADTTSIGLEFDFEYFVVDNLSVGAGIDVNDQRTDSGGSKINNTTKLFSLQGTFHHELSENLNFLAGGYYILKGDKKVTHQETVSVSGWGVFTGVSVLMIRNLALNFGIYKTIQESEISNSSSESDTFGAKMGATLFF